MLLAFLVLAVVAVSQLPLSSGQTNTGPASGGVLDLVLILDFTTYSPADTTDEVAAVKTFANSLLQQLAMDIGEKTTHVGVIKYGRVATTVLRLTDSYDATAIQNTISSAGIEHAIRWGSNMGLAIKQAVTEFTLRGRPVSTTARKAVIISTYPPSDTAQQREGQAHHAENSNVTLYAVGIGPFVDANTLRRITQNDSTRVYLAANVNASLDLIEDLASALLPDTVCKCTGEKGDRGKKGEQGTMGPPGTPGHSGAKGEMGDRGVVGPRGPSGQKGDRGVTGGVGPRGQKGERGYRGATGYGQKGQKGQTGPPGPQEGGTVYTRWGRTSCPVISGTSKVYDGYAAGSKHTGGGGSNFLCLTKTPDYYTTYSGTGYSTIAAVEYEGQTQFNRVNNENAACAVCTTTRNRQLMIPGTRYCPSGWTREYWGYLVSANNGRPRVEFVCFDRYPESIPGSAGDHQSSAEIYPVEVNCDVLPCPPYSSTKELTCVVCTK